MYDEADECEICGEDHETRNCDQTVCGRCFEMVENCDCETCQEIDVEEWIEGGSKPPNGINDV